VGVRLFILLFSLIGGARERIEVVLPKAPECPANASCGDSGVEAVALYIVPQNIGKVRVAMGAGGKYTVWNGKQGKHEFSITCRNRKQAEELVALLNSKDRPKEIEVNY
jgi:hypothetical protein